MPPHHPIMADMPQYIYHSEKSKQFFGRYNSTLKDVVFEDRPPPPSASIPIAIAQSSPTEKVVLTKSSAEAPTGVTAIAANESVTANTSALNLQKPPELDEKDAIFEKLRIKDSTAGMWWWQEMRGA